MPAFVNRFGVEQPDGTKILTASRVSVITATRTSASIPAVFACQYLGNKWGRKRTIWFGCATCLLGTALQTGSVEEVMLTLGLTVASQCLPRLTFEINVDAVRLRLFCHGINGVHPHHRALAPICARRGWRLVFNSRKYLDSTWCSLLVISAIKPVSLTCSIDRLV